MGFPLEGYGRQSPANACTSGPRMVNGARDQKFLVIESLPAQPGIRRSDANQLSASQRQSCRITLNKALWTFTVPL
jgi:hypothetical protein